MPKIKAEQAKVGDWVVHIEEHDSWSIPDPDILVYFNGPNALQEAREYQQDFNATNCPPLKPGQRVPEYYNVAKEPRQVR
jgi:hypothetical protein